MATAKRSDPYVISYFRIEIDSIDAGYFQKCSGLKTETEVFEFQEGGDNETVRKLIGQSKAGNIVLTKGYISDPAVFKWREEIATSGSNKIARRNGAIIALSNSRDVVGRWNFQKAWPVRWEMNEYDGASSQASCEILELAVEKIVKG
ncbi:MAG TPA: phage tail protein [Myxococcales bacterium]|jgi:phage tail-like protein